MRIKLQPEEIVEVVEERLAWLAVASEGRHHYVQDFYRRAVPIVCVGANAEGVIDVAGVEAEELVPCPDDFCRDASVLARHLLPHLGERLSFAECLDREPREETTVSVTSESKKVLRPDDIPGGEDVLMRARTMQVLGVRFQLRAFGMLSAADSRRVLSRSACAQLPGVVYQEVSQLRDGRSVSEYTVYALSPHGKLLHPATGAREDREFRREAEAIGLTPPPHLLDDAGEVIAPSQHLFDMAVFWQYERRREWTVEIALSKGRTGLGLATDALGARELVRAMQLDGSTKPSRRKALLHWVREHMRRNRSGLDAVVRAHLRGKQSVQAGSYWATIWPSREALEGACNARRFDVAP